MYGELVHSDVRCHGVALLGGSVEIAPVGGLPHTCSGRMRASSPLRLPLVARGGQSCCESNVASSRASADDFRIVRSICVLVFGDGVRYSD
jgi:hypothetical protein